MPENLSKKELVKKAEESIKNGLYDAAAVYYDQAILSDLKDPELWMKKGNNLIFLKRYEEAITCYEKAISIDKSDTTKWAILGEALAEYLSRYKEAIYCFEKAIELDPRNNYFWDSLALLYFKTEDWENVIRCCNKLIYIDKDYAEAWRAKAIALNHLGREDEANDCLLKASMIDGRQKLKNEKWRRK